MNNELGVVRATSASAMNDKFLRATSAAGRDLQMSPSLGGIWDKAVQLNQVQRRLKSVLAAAEGKEIHNEELVRYLREASDEASQTEDLLSALVYYRIQEELKPEVIASSNSSDRLRFLPAVYVVCCSTP